MEQIQSGAPMRETGTARQAAAAAPAPVDPSALTPLDAPTGRPEEPLTAGIDQFAGQPASAMDPATKERLQGYLPTLLWLASRPSASEQTRQFVRQLRADL